MPPIWSPLSFRFGAVDQETGRGGRDGLQGDCLLFYNPSDIEKLEKFMKDKPVAEQEIGSLLIAETAAFAESSHCRRKLLLHYFGEPFEEQHCNKMCDNCANPKPKQEVTQELLSMLKAIAGVYRDWETDRKSTRLNSSHRL